MPTLDFKGKQHIYAHHLTVPYRPLVPDDDRSLNPNGVDDNLIIHGDNLYALKSLLPRYAGRVKCIYIDPPYNTGNEGWVYNDKVNSPLMQEWLRENSPVDNEDLERHDKWLCMMWPRLHLLKEMLTEDGVIFVSIDDNEQHHLRMLMDEIFGRGSFVGTLTWISTTQPDNIGRARFGLQQNVEYIHVYSKCSRLDLPPFLLAQNGSTPQYPHVGKFGACRFEIIERSFQGAYARPTMRFAILGQFPREGKQWQIGEAKARELERTGRVEVVDGIVKRAIYPDDESDRGLVPFWAHLSKENVGTSQSGKAELTSILPRHGMETVKPVSLVREVLRHLPSDSLVIDSFAGSGTTAHAVLALNNEDEGNRKFILVECENYADSITAERVRRVIKGVPDACDESLRKGSGGSFTYCTLGDPIEIEGMLTGDALPAYSAMAAYLLHTASGISAGEAELTPRTADGLFYTNGATDYYLLYEPDLDWLSGNEGILNEERAKRITAASRVNGKKAIVFGPGKFIGQRELTALGITFCQLPYEMHRSGQ